MIENRNSILYFDGCNTLELAKQYGTPLYVMSETEILNRIEQLRKSFLYKYDKTRVAYAAKAFCTLAMFHICEREGLCIDVVSGGELYAAVAAGFPPERIEFNGNNKLRSEIEDAVEYGIGRIIVDSLQELELIESVCRQKNKTMKILFRITPQITVDTHDYMVTAKKDSKFGIPLDEVVFFPQVQRALDSGYVDFVGLHFHIGSQLFDNDKYLKATEVLLDMVGEIKRRFGYCVEEINLGGGFGITYTDEVRKDFSYYIDPMMEKISEAYDDMDEDLPAVVIEPGRSIVAEAGITLYTIGSIKNIEGVRKYVSVDGGMTDNIRPALYQATYAGAVADRMNETADDEVTVCGKCCESGDVLIKDIKIPSTAHSGDIFAVFSTGAYGYSMASNYNNNPVPAVVLVKDGRSEIIVKRQSYEDIIRNNMIPEGMVSRAEQACHNIKPCINAFR